MDKAAIRAKAKELVADMPYFSSIMHREDLMEAALTQAYEQGWNERGEADVKACAEVHPCVAVESIDHCIRAIRRLRIEEG